MRVIKTTLNDLMAEIFNLACGEELFVNGKMRTDGVSKPYPVVEEDGVTYQFRLHKIYVYMEDDVEANRKAIRNLYDEWCIIYADKIKPIMGVSPESKRILSTASGHSVLMAPIKVQLHFMTIDSIVRDKLLDFNVRYYICSVMYDPSNITNIPHNNVVYRMNMCDFTGCENSYPHKILVSSMGRPLGMYFSKVWKHYPDIVTYGIPFENVNTALTTSEWDESMMQNCFLCTSKLYDSNYVLSKPKLQQHNWHPDSVSICPWCYHSFSRSCARASIWCIYRKVEVVQFPISSRDLIADVEDHELRHILTQINDNFSANVASIGKNGFKYVTAGEYVGIDDLSKFIRHKLYNHHDIAGKKIFVIEDSRFLIC